MVKRLNIRQLRKLVNETLYERDDIIDAEFADDADDADGDEFGDDDGDENPGELTGAIQGLQKALTGQANAHETSVAIRDALKLLGGRFGLRDESVKRLKRLVNEALEENMGSQRIPETYRDFRKQIVMGLKQAGAPEDLVDEAADFGDEGSGVFSAIWKGWQMVEHALSDVERLGPEDYVQEDLADEYAGAVYETIVSMVEAYSNSMNYGPGHRPERINAGDLADQVLSALAL